MHSSRARRLVSVRAIYHGFVGQGVIILESSLQRKCVRQFNPTLVSDRPPFACLQASSADEAERLKAAHQAEVQRLEEAALRGAERAAEEVCARLGPKLEAATDELASAEQHIAGLQSDLEVRAWSGPGPSTNNASYRLLILRVML